MKVRNGFVSNSSSSSFLITNKTKDEKTLVDFVIENFKVIEQFIETRGWYYDTMGELIDSAYAESMSLHPGENYCTFDDDGGSVVGNILRTLLQSFESSENFKCIFVEDL